MTELEKKANSSWEKNNTVSVETDNEDAYKAGYIAGAMENGIQWHKVADDDLPDNTDSVLSDKGVIVFEKKAKEYSLKYCNGLVDSDDIEMLKIAYQDGAEFGYNKANEWHYVKDGDLPKDEDYKWCISRGGYCYVAKYEELFVSWRNQENKDVLCPYAWKEIVLPTMENI